MQAQTSRKRRTLLQSADAFLMNDTKRLPSSFIWMPYHEPSTDTTTKKIEGGILNAFLFIVMVVCVTFVLVGLFYFRCMKVSDAIPLSTHGG